MEIRQGIELKVVEEKKTKIFRMFNAKKWNIPGEGRGREVMII